MSHWVVSGAHYAKTAQAWLENMKQHQSEIISIFAQIYGMTQAKRYWNYWLIFFMACEELWGYNRGREWLVSHYLLNKR